MKFTKVTASKYIGDYGYEIIQCKSGLFSICKNGVVSRWGTGFQTVRSAEYFLENRNYVKATSETLPIEQEDLDFIATVYGGTLNRIGHQLITDTFTLSIPNDFNKTHQVKLKANVKGDPAKMISDVESLLLELDELSGPVFSSVTYRGTELRAVLAKSQRRSAKEIVKDLIRVKSSNVWSYGVEIKDNNAKEGDVYVQFKGKNGGPGDVYRYYDVPVSLWRKFISFPSKGAFIWKYLRNNFLYSKLTGDKKGKLKNAVN